MQLSEKARQLIPKARIVSFATWKDLHSDSVIAIFQKADDEARYLTDEDLTTLQTLSPHLENSIQQGRLLTEKANELIAKSREQVLAQFPDLIKPGGGLYPPERAEACWRDFWHFLRCITYGVVGQSTQFTSFEGLENMALLYEELRVPIPAMIYGLENLKIYSLKLFEASEQKQLSPYFDHLTQALTHSLQL